MSMILFPCAPGRVSGADSVGYHLGCDLKRLIVNRLPLGRAALRDPIEHVSVEIPKADVGKGERQAHLACEFEHLHKEGTGFAFKNQLDEHSIGHFLPMKELVRGWSGREAVVDRMGGSQARRFKAKPRE